MQARCPELTFDITTKVEHILEHPDVIAELRDLGLLFIVSAVESTSARVLDLLDKGHSAEDILTALRICRALGIELRPSLLPFTPWSTLGDQLDLLDMIATNDLIDSVDPVQLSIRLLVPPGSLLLELPEMREHLLGYDPEGFSHLWQHPDPVMDALHADIAALVAADTDAGVAPRSTHSAIRAAHRRGGRRGRVALAGRGRATPTRAGGPASIERAVVLLRRADDGAARRRRSGARRLRRPPCILRHDARVTSSLSSGTSWPELAERLTQALHPLAAPIAITFLDAPSAAIPAFDAAMPAPTPDGRTGRVAAGCVFWMLSTERTFTTDRPTTPTAALAATRMVC